MIKISFDPKITREKIDIALSNGPSQDDKLFAELKTEQKKEKKGFLGKIKTFLDEGRKDPKNVMRDFLKSYGNYKVATASVLHSVLQDISVDDFSSAWQKIYQEDIPNLIKFQETTSCSKCNQQANGLWTVLNYQLPDYLVKGSIYYLGCTNCEAVYCSDCYLQIEKVGLIAKLSKIRNCPNCDTEFDQFLRVFSPNPQIQWGQDSLISVTEEIQMDGRIAHLEANTKIKSSLRKIVQPDSLWDDTLSDLGDRGVVEIAFINTAILVGDYWFLLSAMPGEMTISKDH